MNRLTLKAAFVSVMIFAVFIGAWHLATLPTGGAASASDAEYAKLMKTPAADIANQATVRDGGASSAAAFLSVFAEDVRWAHLDIAATANTSGRDRHSTGRPVPMLMRFLLKKMR